ncbi:MAG: acyl-CoA thioesterase [Mariniblastus sp.]
MNNSTTIASFQFEREVRIVDTDTSGFAHCGAYIRMMEETEYAFLRSRGLSVVAQDELGTLGFPRLNASLKIHQPLAFEQKVQVDLELTEIDGKQITYEFKINAIASDVSPTPNGDDNQASSVLVSTPAVEGRFQVAVCRFPAGKPPYAILTPDHIVEALTCEKVTD